MENIFDHGITEDEQRAIFDMVYKDREVYDLFFSAGGDTSLADLFSLYMHRGDKKKAKTFLAKISNREYAADIALFYGRREMLNEEEKEEKKEKKKKK
ncbi:MAG: hypothetical protein ACT4NX_02755 [Deltaproteobacteria bacterium]